MDLDNPPSPVAGPLVQGEEEEVVLEDNSDCSSQETRSVISMESDDEGRIVHYREEEPESAGGVGNENERAPPSPLEVQDPHGRNFEEACAQFNDLIEVMRNSRVNILKHINIEDATFCLNASFGCRFKTSNEDEYEYHRLNCEYNMFSYCHDPVCQRDEEIDHVFENLEAAIDHEVNIHGKPSIASLEFEFNSEIINKAGIQFIGKFVIDEALGNFFETDIALYIRITKNGKIVPFIISHDGTHLNPTEMRLVMKTAVPGKRNNRREPILKTLPLYEYREDKREHRIIINDPDDYLFQAFPSLESLMRADLMNPVGNSKKFPYFKISDIQTNQPNQSNSSGSARTTDNDPPPQPEKFVITISGKVYTLDFTISDAVAETEIIRYGFVNSWKSLIPFKYRNEASTRIGGGPESPTGLHPDLEMCFRNNLQMQQPRGMSRGIVTAAKSIRDLTIYALKDQDNLEALKAAIIGQAVSCFYEKLVSGSSRRKRRSMSHQHIYPNIVITTDNPGSASIIKTHLKNCFPFLGVFLLRDIMTNEFCFLNMMNEPDVLIVTTNDLDQYWNNSRRRTRDIPRLSDRVKLDDTVSLYIYLNTDRYPDYFQTTDKENNLMTTPNMKHSRRVLITRADMEFVLPPTVNEKMISIFCGPTFDRLVRKLDFFEHYDMTEFDKTWDWFKAKWFIPSKWNMNRVLMIAQSDTGLQELEHNAVALTLPVPIEIIRRQDSINDTGFRNKVGSFLTSGSPLIVMCTFLAIGNLEFKNFDSVFVYGIHYNFVEFIRQAEIASRRLIVLTSDNAKDESQGQFAEFCDRVAGNDDENSED